MDRKNITTLYSDIFEQVGGKSSQNNHNNKDNKKNDFYIPSDLSLKSQADLSKVFKANRLLKKELNETKQELNETKQELEKTKALLNKLNK
tara:strand:+ start:273 stop:545 length:273 start_codon:yes stop_codon:yes gene_type:complete